ncbi:MAG: amino acid adenylation domain-containing protein, partial [Psychrosphaera sp.]|nr:amino acid adenylation domain-containing protein [Psychrosphaera sp.]
MVDTVAARQKSHFRRQRYPIGQIINTLRQHDENRSLYDVCFNYLKLDSQLSFDGVDAHLEYLSHNHEKTPLTLTLWEYGEGQPSQLQIDYNGRYFKAAEITALTTRLVEWMGQLLNHPQQHLSQFSLVTPAERRVMQGSGSELYDQCHDLLIQQRFAAQVNKTPNAVALVFNDQQLTYRQLDTRANQLAHYLLRQGLVNEALVGVAMNRSISQVVAILAIIKAGGAYVPLDPGYPQNRLRQMIDDGSIGIVVTESALCGRFTQVFTVAVDGLERQLAECDSGPVEISGQSPASLAYVLYTSGTTGQPKGVMVTHAGVVRLTVEPGFMVLDSQTRFVQAAPLSFDAATLELWGPLLNGGCCVLYTADKMDLACLNRLIEQQKINALWLTASLFEQWCRLAPDLPSLQWIITGGDVVSPQAVAQCREFSHARLVNGYGPTENTTFTTCNQIPKLADSVPLSASLPIGKAIEATGVYVLSASKTLLPPGCVGELYTGGAGVARGYLNQPELTAECFIQNPFSDDPQARLYRTGDRVRLLPDGNLVFVGRGDHQVKVSGFRIEPAEVEYQLNRLPAIESSLVVAHNQQLLAYIKPHEDPGPAYPSLVADLTAQLS